MRKRGTISRCCCGDGAAGTCPDACLSTWNGCAPSATGQRYVWNLPDISTQVLAFKGAYENCGWVHGNFNRFNPSANVIGANGQFEAYSNVLFAIDETLTRYFQYDYRVPPNKITVELDVEFEFVSQYNTITDFPDNRSFLLLGVGIRKNALQIVSDRGVRLNPDTITLFANNQWISLPVLRNIVRVERTFASSSPFRSERGLVNIFDGEKFARVDSCREEFQVQISIFINDVLATEFLTTETFYGAECYAGIPVRFAVQNPRRVGFPEAPWIKTHNMTISVT